MERSPICHAARAATLGCLAFASAAIAQIVDVPLRTTVQDRGVSVTGLPQRRSHTHGGPHVDAPPPRMSIEASRDAEIRFARVELLRRHCRESEWHLVRDQPVLEWRAGGSATSNPASTPLRLRTGERAEVLLTVAPVPVYSACDIFAYRTYLEVNGGALMVESRLEIVRREPIRRLP